MCYKCEVCRSTVPHGTSRMVHAIQRPRAGTKHLEIHREVAICQGCKSALELGVSFWDLLRQNGRPIPLFRPAPSRPVMVGREAPQSPIAIMKAIGKLANSVVAGKTRNY